jgi:hypothetical protein
MDATTYMTGAEAKDLGYCDVCVPAKKMAAVLADDEEISDRERELFAGLEIEARDPTVVVDADGNDGCVDCVNCTGCSGCTSCMKCTGCDGCTGCTQCEGCDACSGCSECEGCQGCTDCSGCEGCASCSVCIDCEGCKGCTDCTDCKDCVDCTDCEGCVGMTGQTGMKGPNAKAAMAEADPTKVNPTEHPSVSASEGGAVALPADQNVTPALNASSAQDNNQAASIPTPQKAVKHMSDNGSVTVARALGLPVGASETDMVAAASRCREIELQIMGLTGAASSAEALGALRALKEKADKVEALTKEAETLRAQRDGQDFEVQVQRGYAERKLTPALEKQYRAEFETDLSEGRGERGVARIKGFVDNAQKAPERQHQPLGHRNSAGPDALTWNGKSYKDLTFQQRADLKSDDPELWASMKQDWEDAGRPPRTA